MSCQVPGKRGNLMIIDRRINQISLCINYLV